MAGKTAHERRWPLSDREVANLKLLTQSLRDVGVLYVTDVAVAKAINDATSPLRTLFRDSGFHDYARQDQGPSAKVVKDCIVLQDHDALETKVSLYRPQTKTGDPRLHIYRPRRSPGFVRAWEVLALMVHEGALYVVNLSRSRACEGSAPAVSDFLARASRQTNAVAEELLSRLRQLAAMGPLPAVATGDHAVGRTIEVALGLTPNSNAGPDYKGIELKGARSLRGKGRPKAQLFSQVPDWAMSPYKGVTQIWNRYGYLRDERRLLRCTVSLDTPNAQGLYLSLPKGARALHERGVLGGRDELVAVWPLDLLHRRLLEKHAETFWLRADAFRRDGMEYYSLIEVVHTRGPSAAMFDEQLASGTITVDHMMEPRTPTAAYEKGPSFKVRRSALELLFPMTPRRYVLASV